MPDAEGAADFYMQWKSNLSIRQTEGQKILVEVFDQLDEGSRRLLPFLHKTLKTTLREDLLIQALRGYYRHCWYKNQILINELKKVIGLLSDHDISTIVTKGLALSQLYYQDFGARPMSDIDLMVKESEADEALLILQQNQWKDLRTQSLFLSPRETIADSRTLINDRKVELDFHWRFLRESFNDSWNQRIWEHKVPLSIQGCTTHTLKPGDQLLHTLVHGLEWNQMPGLRWALDAHMIVKKAEVDWDDLLRTAREWRFQPFLKEGLVFLETLGSPVPPTILKRLSQSSVSVMEKIYFHHKLKPRSPGSINHILLRLYQMKLYYPGTLWRGLGKVIKSFSVNWAIPTSFKTPFVIILQALQVIKHPSEKTNRS